MEEIKRQIEGLLDMDPTYAYECLTSLLEESGKTNEVYRYFDVFAPMMESARSYVRTRGMALIAANAKWDEEGRIEKVLEKLLSHITDEKPVTARQCVKILPDLAREKPELAERIAHALRQADFGGYKQSMASLMEKDRQKALKEIKAI